MRIPRLVALLVTLLLSNAVAGEDARPVPTPAPPSRAQRVEAALSKLAMYFGAKGAGIEEPDVVMVCSLLQRRFDVGVGLFPLADFYRAQPQLREKQFQLYDLFFDDRRLPNKPPAEIEADLHRDYPARIDGFTDWSMYCPKFPLPADFLPMLRKRVREGKSHYWVTHAPLQLRNAITNGCLVKGPEVEALIEEVTAALRRDLDQRRKRDDVLIESTVMLYYLDRADLVRPADIDWILDRRLRDGGWQASAGTGRSHNHTTMLALWTLLEWRARADSQTK